MYHYTECGLVNVWLANGYNEKQTAYGKAVSIDEVDSLHAVLAIEITKKQGRMTGKELRFLRVLMEMSQASMARMLGATEQSVSLWERTGKVPRNADAMTRLLVLERFKGDGSKVTQIVERINVVERLIGQRIVASERGHKWTSKTETVRETASA